MKVGIITMHKELNYGSALQAYALQKKLFDLGIDNEIIDYLYHKPNPKKNPLRNTITQMFLGIKKAILGIPIAVKKKKFEKFYNNFFVLTQNSYNEISLKANPPLYDIYLTGSDQVWNPRFIGSDTNFLLSFVPFEKKKVSFASSFATNHIEGHTGEIFAECLSKYDALSVRETSGVKIIRELTGREAEVCCDPTLLLCKNDWNKIADRSTLSIRKKYILVYILSYMCDLYPQVDNLIASVQKIFGIKVIYLVGRKEDAFKPNSRLIKSAGPTEFTYLFKNAEFVITSSFHGAVFSLIYDKPFFGVVDRNNDSDSRIQSLLKVVGAERSIIDFRETVNKRKEELMLLKGNPALINMIKDSSVEFIKRHLQ